MRAKILDGNVLAKMIKDQLKDEVGKLRQKYGKVPTLVNIIVGYDSGSCVYASSQKKTTENIGIGYRLELLPKDISQESVIEGIEILNNDSNVHGIMINRPVPSHIGYGVIANHVDYRKDIEGINVANIGMVMLGEANFLPCTPAAVMEHIRSTGVLLRGKEVVVVGHSRSVGKPLALLLLKQLATVTVCNIGTSEAGNLKDHVSRAEILIVAVGKPGLIKGDWIKPGAIVIDVGINNLEGRIVGDVEFEEATERASYITPVPGGVGPVTVAMLMRNTVEAFKTQMQK